MAKQKKKKTTTAQPDKPIHPRKLIIPVMIGVAVAMLLPAIGIPTVMAVAVGLLVMGLSLAIVLRLSARKKDK